MASPTLRIRLLGELDLRAGDAPIPPSARPGSSRCSATCCSTARRPSPAGVYVNFISDEGGAGVETAYGRRLERLTALKDRYDPANVFRMNANIPPTPAGRRGQALVR